MTRHFCDACGKECPHLHRFDYACHIGTGKPHKVFVTIDESNPDGTLVPWNGRTDHAEVCTRCYNAILWQAYGQFQHLRKINSVTRCHECGATHETGANPQCSR